MKTILIIHLPVVHRGYVDLLHKHHPDTTYIIGEGYLSLLEYLSRDVRALTPQENLLALQAVVGRGFEIEIISNATLALIKPEDEIIMSDEDITRAFAKKYFPNRGILWDSAFLRWNMQNVTKEFPVDPDEEISTDQFDREMMEQANKVAEKSPDWWRQVGVVVVIEDEITITSFNTHTVGEYSSYVDGDPRTPFRPGERIDVSISEHAEARIVAYFARSNASLSGAKIYVTTFPCPTCARLLVSAGVRQVYYSNGYSLVNAREVFRENGVKVTRVLLD